MTPKELAELEAEKTFEEFITWTKRVVMYSVFFLVVVVVGCNSGVEEGPNATGYSVSVDGKIMCEELRVELSSSWPDYVFEDDYDKMSLNDVDEFIQANKHLPGIPSAKVMEDIGGIDMGDMLVKLVEKVEELTLYTIEQQKVIEELQSIIQSK